jgi:hypothetical protein
MTFIESSFVSSSFVTFREFSVNTTQLSSSYTLTRERYPLTSQLITENKIPEFGKLRV